MGKTLNMVKMAFDSWTMVFMLAVVLAYKLLDRYLNPQLQPNVKNKSIKGLLKDEKKHVSKNSLIMPTSGEVKNGQDRGKLF